MPTALLIEVLEPQPSELRLTRAANSSIWLSGAAGFTYFLLGNRLLTDWSFTNPSFLTFWAVVFGLGCLLYLLIRKYQSIRLVAKLAEATSHEGLRLARASVLILRGVDDEAALALALGAIVNRVTRWAARVLEKFYNYGMIILMVTIGCLGLSTFLLEWQRATTGEDWLIGSLRLLIIFLFVASGATVFLMAFSGLSKAVYGRELLFGPIACNISSHSVPDIIHNRVRCITLNQGRKRMLRHKLYDDPNCASKISDWLDEQLHAKDNVKRATKA